MLLPRINRRRKAQELAAKPQVPDEEGPRSESTEWSKPLRRGDEDEKTAIRAFGAGLPLFGVTVAFWILGYGAGYGDATRYYEQGTYVLRPGCELGVIVFVPLGLSLMFIGFQLVRWTDEGPRKT